MENNNKEILYINKIVKKRNKFTLDIENLLIYKNKINIILGENGSGKSTFLNEVLNNSDVLNGHKKVLLTQNTYTFNRTCYANIAMVLKWNNSNKNPMEFLQLVELDNKKNDIGKNLSGGEKKRLAFAMALATDAEIILLDEPFANIDEKNQLKLIEIIKSLKKTKTIILVSHRLEICREIGDYFHKMNNGHLENVNLV